MRHCSENPTPMKYCSKCQTEKTLDFFFKDKSRKDGYALICKVCRLAHLKIKRETDAEFHKKCKERSAAYRKRFPEQTRNSIRNATLKLKYGITSLQYNEMFSAQGNCCKVCKRTESKGYGTFHVDHCHTTGKIRGILCQPCNVTLGKMEESPEKLRALANYIETHKGA